MIAWTTVENAIHAWAVAGSGYNAAQVIWSMLTGPRPTGAYIALRFMSINRVGHDWTDYQNADPAIAGAELDAFTRGNREAMLSIQAFAGVDGNAIGTASPTAILESVMSAAASPSVRTSLGTAGIGIGEVGPVLTIDGTLGSAVLEPRATMDARLLLASEIASTDTYIQYVHLSNTTLGTSTWVPEEPI